MKFSFGAAGGLFCEVQAQKLHGFCVQFHGEDEITFISYGV
jgi:hypothetical protein